MSAPLGKANLGSKTQSPTAPIFNMILLKKVFESGFLLILLASALQVDAETIELDLNSDASKEWLEVSCVYNVDYNDFWVFGYPVELTGEENEEGFPANKGFWTPGTAETCEIHYYGGPDLENAKTLTFRLYLKGESPKIEVRGKSTPLGMDYNIAVGSISKENGEGWFEFPMDMADNTGAKVLSIVLTSSGEDRLLLDKIIVNLGEDVPAPTTPPTTTTENPIQDELVTLKTERDYLNIWDTNCHYADNYAYFWPYGKDCAVNPTSTIPEDFSGVGYWTPCAGQTCRIRYVSNSTIVPKVPASIQLRTYTDGNPSIEISLQDLRYVNSELDCENCQPIHSLLMGEKRGWSESDALQLLKNPGMHYIVNIDLVAGPNDVVMLNQVNLNLVEQVTTEPPSTTPTTPRTRPTVPGETGATGSSGTETTPETSTESAASSSFGKETLFAHIVMLCLYFIFGK